MVENVIQIKCGITVNVDASAKNIIYVKKIIFRILLHVAVKMIHIYQDDSLITCDGIINAEAKSYDEEIKTVSTNFNEKKFILILLYFTCIFFKDHFCIDNC